MTIKILRVRVVGSGCKTGEAKASTYKEQRLCWSSLRGQIRKKVTGKTILGQSQLTLAY
jgi:hypothetical protein